MVTDIGLDQLGIAQHGLPVVVLHPLIFIGTGAPQLFDGDRDFLGDGRNGTGHSGSGSLVYRTGAGEGRRCSQKTGCGAGSNKFAAIHRYPLN